jgi:uncharacterized protein
MRIEWNQTKNWANQAKHNVSFETASLVFDDPHHLSIQDRHEQGEVIRIISARKATKTERRIYEQAYKKTKN